MFRMRFIKQGPLTRRRLGTSVCLSLFTGFTLLYPETTERISPMTAFGHIAKERAFVLILSLIFNKSKLMLYFHIYYCNYYTNNFN